MELFQEVTELYFMTEQQFTPELPFKNIATAAYNLQKYINGKYIKAYSGQFKIT